MTVQNTVTFVLVCVAAVVLVALYRRMRERELSLLAQQEVDRLDREEAAGAPPSSRDYHYAISYDSEGVSVANLRDTPRSAESIRWAEICQATAFKRDLFTVDQLCLFLERPDETGIELNENMARWTSFVEALPEHLPGCRPWSEWFAKVAFPAFVPNTHRIYDRGLARPIAADSGPERAPPQV